jgi:HD-GYP domain-containing protein (c-di-GMP phosphodiesterase class II)
VLALERGGESAYLQLTMAAAERDRSSGTELRRQLERLTEIGIALSSERSLVRLLDMILREARLFTRAEAGTLYVRDAGVLRFAVFQNDRIPAGMEPSPDTTIPIARSSLAGYVAATGQPLNLADVGAIPGGAEYRFNDSFDRSTGFCTRSMLVLPLVQPSGEVNGVIQLINARDDTTGEIVPFDAATESMCRSLASQAGVALHNARLTDELEQAYQETVYRLARAAEFRDADTGQHIRRVSYYARELALALGLDEEQANLLMLASPMHDVGKVAVPDAILKKAGPLTPEERRQMCRHTELGGAILEGSQVPLLRLSREIALTHHERWDGGGYPSGLAGDEIPIAGRILAVVDVFDALTSTRCYKPPIAVAAACEYLRAEAGSHFDPEVVEAFLRVLPSILEIRERYPDQR